MKPEKKKTLVTTLCLIAITCAAMAYANRDSGLWVNPFSSGPDAHSGTTAGGGNALTGSGGGTSGNATPDQPRTGRIHAAGNSSRNGGVTVSGALIQDKVFADGEATVEIALTLRADEVIPPESGIRRHVDMVIVLDRSGSMQGEKLGDARRAVTELLSLLGPEDRLALVSYSDGVVVHSPLTGVTDNVRRNLATMALRIMAQGGTNLGAGLTAGIDTLTAAPGTGNPGRVILISHGLANQGITDPAALANIASAAARREFALSTVGVGNDFNERLMTSLADHGTGTYYYLENPAAFAGVFAREFRNARAVAAEGISVTVPLPEGARLVHAGGYPVTHRNGTAVFHPGALLSGQTRKLFLRLRLPAGKPREYVIGGIQADFRQDGKSLAATLPAPLSVACVKDPREAIASIDKDAWEQKVLQDDYNRLKEEVAADINKGDRRQALDRIRQYRTEKQSLNSVVESGVVADNLENDLGELTRTVEETFTGAPAAVSLKKKRNAKALQFEGYRGKRSAQ